MRRPPGPLVGRPPDLPPASVLGLRHKHGTKMRYLSGCHCWRCRRGTAEYDAKLAHDRKLYGPNDLVSSERVLAHLRYLQTFGIGHKTVAKHAHVAKTSLAEMIWYDRRHVRRRSEARILAIQPSLDTFPRNVNVPADETIGKIHQLTLWGYPKSLIAREGLGNKSIGLLVHSLKGKTPNTTVRTAVNIRDFYNLIVTMRRIWQENRGQIPERHYVYWKARRGRRPVIPVVRSLELRQFAMTYNYNYLWPKELKEASAMARALKRQIRERREKLRGKQGKQTEVVGPARPSVRAIGKAKRGRQSSR